PTTGFTQVPASEGRIQKADTPRSIAKARNPPTIWAGRGGQARRPGEGGAANPESGASFGAASSKDSSRTGSPTASSFVATVRGAGTGVATNVDGTSHRGQRGSLR